MIVFSISVTQLMPATSVHDVAEILHALSWPLVVFLIAVMFRKPLAGLIGNVRELKWRDFRIRFARELQQVHEIANTTQALPQVPRESEEFRLDASMLELAERSPRAVVLEAWAKVESASRALAREQVPGFDHSRPSSARVGDILSSAGLLDDARARVFTILRNLRNRAAHEDDFALTPADAVDYAGLAVRLAAALEEATGRPSERAIDAAKQ